MVVVVVIVVVVVVVLVGVLVVVIVLSVLHRSSADRARAFVVRTGRCAGEGTGLQLRFE